MVLLVASIPVAIEIVTTTTLALGSRFLSSHGAIVAMSGICSLQARSIFVVCLSRCENVAETYPRCPHLRRLSSARALAALLLRWRYCARDIVFE